MLLRGV